MNNLVSALIASILPISELRGGIPLAYFSGNGIILSFLACTLANALIIPLIWIFLDEINHLLMKNSFYNKLFNKSVERARRKIQKNIEKYEYLGLMIFIAIPLPMTGAYTGVLAAWALGMERRKAIIYSIFGVIIAGLIVSTVVYLGLGAFNLFIKG
jgi:uncharacterized membrane protein